LPKRSGNTAPDPIGEIPLISVSFFACLSLFIELKMMLNYLVLISGLLAFAFPVPNNVPES
jgi:hypothetical protein